MEPSRQYNGRFHLISIHLLIIKNCTPKNKLAHISYFLCLPVNFDPLLAFFVSLSILGPTMTAGIFYICILKLLNSKLTACIFSIQANTPQQFPFIFLYLIILMQFFSLYPIQLSFFFFKL